MQKSAAKKQGYTLIELLLVIALIAIITAFALMIFRKQAVNTRINKASLEVQQVLEAALSYHNLTSKWPDNNNELPNCEAGQSALNFIDNYIPNAQTKSSLGSNYCWAKSGTNGQLFWVAIKSPNNDINFAKRLSAHLPNAVVTSKPNEQAVEECTKDNTCYVRTEITGKGEQEASKSLPIVATGNCAMGVHAAEVPDKGSCLYNYAASSDTVDKFDVKFNQCPENTSPQISAYPNFITMPGLNTSDLNYKLKRSQAIVDYNSCRKSSTDNTETCQINVQVQTCTDKQCVETEILKVGRYTEDATVGASYLVACKPNSVQKQKLL